MAAPVPRRAVPDRHFPGWRGPTEKPFGIRVAHVDTSTAHRHAEIVVPESSVTGNIISIKPIRSQRQMAYQNISNIARTTQG